MRSRTVDSVEWERLKRQTRLRLRAKAKLLAPADVGVGHEVREFSLAG